MHPAGELSNQSRLACGLSRGHLIDPGLESFDVEVHTFEESVFDAELAEEQDLFGGGVRRERVMRERRSSGREVTQELLRSGIDGEPYRGASSESLR